jgi:hypothetical protein
MPKTSLPTDSHVRTDVRRDRVRCHALGGKGIMSDAWGKGGRCARKIRRTGSAGLRLHRRQARSPASEAARLSHPGGMLKPVAPTVALQTRSQVAGGADAIFRRRQRHRDSESEPTWRHIKLAKTGAAQKPSKADIGHGAIPVRQNTPPIVNPTETASHMTSPAVQRLRSIGRQLSMRVPAAAPPSAQPANRSRRGIDV